MEARWILLVILVLLVFQVQPVHSPKEPISSAVNNNSSQVPYHVNGPCENSTIVCSVMVSSKDKFFSWFSSAVSIMILFCPLLRVKELKPNPRTDAQTLFCWFLYIGFYGYIIWFFYLLTCHHPRYSAFPVLLTCFFGGIIHMFLLVKATLKTSALGDNRLLWIAIFMVFAFAGGVAYQGTQIIGWIGVALSVLSHFCRIASTEYYAKINWYLFFTSMVGSVNGFLWLIHPQLCISREYKIGSYIVGCLRGLEAFLWLSRPIAKMLSKMEGETIEPPAACSSATTASS